MLHSLLNQSQHNESKHFQRSLLQRTQNDEEHVEHNITNHIPSLQLLQPSSHHLTPPFTRPSRTPSMNHFRRSFRRDNQSTSSPISLLPIRQIDPYASSMLLLCISALLPMIGIEMGSTTIQISRFYLPHDQIDYPLVDVRTTKKSLTSQLRR